MHIPHVTRVLWYTSWFFTGREILSKFTHLYITHCILILLILIGCQGDIVYWQAILLYGQVNTL